MNQSTNPFLQYTLIVTGDEILSGRRQDRHIPYLNSALAKLGMECRRCFIVGDNDRTLSSTTRDALQETPVVIVTGGLGPTLDDITREALSDATGISLLVDSNAMRELKEKFVAIGRPMTDNNKRQAQVPILGQYFSNPNGTAPGLVFDAGEKIAVALPGPPRELEPMVQDQLIPFLQKRFSLSQAFLNSKMRFCCQGESNIDAVVREKLGHIKELRVASLSSAGKVDLTLSLLDQGKKTKKLLAQCTKAIRDELGDSIYSYGDESLAETVGKLLREQKQRLAVAESCTGGLLASQITATPGASDYFLGGVVAYSNIIKVNILGIEPKLLEKKGAVSQECVEQMTEGVRKKFDSDWGIGITGIAGPGGGSEEKPVGTVFVAAGCGEKKTYPIALKLFGSRDAVRERSCVYALDQLRRLLLLLPPHS